MVKTIGKLVTGAEFLWAVYGYISGFWRSAEMIGDWYISPGLIQDFYMLAALLGGAVLLGLTWDSVQPAWVNWRYGKEIAEEAAEEDWRRRLRGALQGYLLNQSLVNKLYLGEVLEECGLRLPKYDSGGADFGPVLMELALKHLNDGNVDKVYEIFESTEE